MFCPSLNEDDRHERSHRNDQERHNGLKDGHGHETMPSGPGPM